MPFSSLQSNGHSIRQRWEDPGGRIGFQGMFGELLASGNTGALAAIGAGSLNSTLTAPTNLQC